MLLRFTKTFLLCLASLVVAPVSAGTLDQVTFRGALRCGVNTDLPGFAKANSLGEYSGFDVDVCRAVATAVFNDSEAVDMVPLTTSERFNALQSGAVDILSRNTTWTLERNAIYGSFVGINFFDGQGFMVSKRSAIRSALELDNQSVCVSRNTTSELNAADFFSISDLRYKPVFYTDEAQATAGFVAGACTALTTDRSALAAQRASFKEPDAYLVLPEVISKEPLGPLVPHNDIDWENVVRWSLNCMINAEELGISSTNANNPRVASTPSIKRLLGIEGNSGKQLSLDKEWCKRIILQVGNYGEIYNRHIGPNTPIGLARGINNLWSNGGLIYAPPIR